MMTILTISYDNFLSHTLIYKLVFVKIKIKKIVIKLFHYYFGILDLFFSIIVYVTTFHKYLKLALPNLEYLFAAIINISMTKTIDILAIICVHFSCRILFMSYISFVSTNRCFLF